MGFKINVDRFGFAKEPKPEKNSRDYAAELAKSLIDKEEAERINEDAVLLGKITAEESARATAIEQLQEETDRKLTAESDAREADKAELRTEIDDKITGEVVARNDAISDAIADEVASRNNAITQEANIRSAKDAQLEEAIKAEQSARETADSNLSKEIEGKVDKKEDMGLASLTFDDRLIDGNGNRYDMLNIFTHTADGEHLYLELPIYLKWQIDSMLASGGSVDLSGYYTKTEIDAMYGDIDSALDAIIALQVENGGDSE